MTKGLWGALALACRGDDPTVAVVLDNEDGQGSFFFGDTVCGTVCVQSASDRLKCTALAVSVVGRVVTALGNADDTLVAGKRQRTRVARFDVLPPTLLWHAPEQQRSAPFPAPGTAFAFALATPRSALCFPPSFEGRYGCVRYYVRAVLARPHRPAVVARQPLVLVPHVPPGALAVHCAPVQRDFALRVCRGAHGARVAVALGLARAAFVPREPVAVWATIANRTPRAVVQALLTLTQDCVYRGRHRARTVTTRLACVAAFPEFFALRRGQQTALRHTLTLPACAPSFVHAALAVSYRVALVLHTRTGVFECSVPFVVGSQELPPPPPSAVSLPALPAPPLPPSLPSPPMYQP